MAVPQHNLRTFSADERAQLVERIIASPQFHKSSRLQTFLRYVAERTFSDHSEEVNERDIAQHVFGRGVDYSSSEDTIVRVTARQLRMKLREYFDTAGANEPLVLEIPKGSYRPVLIPRDAPPSAEPALISAAPPPARWNRARLLLVPLLAACAAIGWFARDLEVGAQPSPSLLRSLLPDAHVPTVVVVADSGLVVRQELSGRKITLEEYSAARPGEATTPEADRFGEYLRTRRYTSLADVLVYGRILRGNPDRWQSLSVRHARDVSLRDLRDVNVVLVGSPRSNPWGTLFDRKLNFVFDYDSANQRAFVRNLAPRPGEQERYVSDSRFGSSGASFAAVSAVPNLNPARTVVMIAGTTMEASEAAGNFVTSSESLAQIRQITGGRDVREVLPLELLLRTTAVAGVAGEQRVIASRVSAARR